MGAWQKTAKATRFGMSPMLLEASRWLENLGKFNDCETSLQTAQDLALETRSLEEVTQRRSPARFNQNRNHFPASAL